VIAILRQPEPITGAQPADTIERSDTLVSVGKAGQYPEFRRLLSRGDSSGSAKESSGAGE
jgi:K+/H+ antiporter YhaU regulatory subunit KhtT